MQSDQKSSFLRSPLDQLLCFPKLHPWALPSSHARGEPSRPPGRPFTWVSSCPQAGLVPSSWPAVDLPTFPCTASHGLLGTQGSEAHFCKEQSVCHKIPSHLYNPISVIWRCSFQGQIPVRFIRETALVCTDTELPNVKHCSAL